MTDVVADRAQVIAHDPEADPAALGVDARRLAALDRYLANYVTDGRLPGWQLLVSRRGQVVHQATCGWRDLEADLPVEPDTIFRIYSMSKPITSVAAMGLVEEGALELDHPVSQYLPAFADCRIYVDGQRTEALAEPMRIWHLLTHTSGLTYGFLRAHPVDALYREAGYEFAVPHGADTASAVATWAGLPLLFEPGAEWNYSVSTDVLGHVLEVVTGTSLHEVLTERVLGPLGMTDTAFHVPAERRDRLAALYVAPGGPGTRARGDDLGRVASSPPRFQGGGGGLMSTAADYHRFTRMLLGGGELDGVRVLSPRALAYMTRNHLPGGADLAAFGRTLFAETRFEGVGFGLGFAVVLDPAAERVLANAGEYSWGGAASTAFYVDPREELICVFMTQLLPSSTYPIRGALRTLVYQALVDRPPRP
ncbi:MAG: serine hydrolase domain-containing protein [Mycobacteriales bacterium]